MNFSLTFLLDTVMPKLLAAVPTTLALLLLSGIASMVIGIPLALAAGSRYASCRWPARGWIMLVRGTPLLVQLCSFICCITASARSSRANGCATAGRRRCCATRSGMRSSR
ncbi:ABC transporter permease subunit [Burkholderia contaminans]|uniref:ABC transporter permease subunit n=1 Tax=Burkholderia contaminans TaxID=488447 RepID=UPI003D675D09